MSEATAPLPALAPGGDALMHLILAEIRAGNDLLRTARGDPAELILHDGRLADLGADLRDYTAAIRQAAMARTMDEMAAPAAPVPAPAPRHRHRRSVPRQRDGTPALRSVKGLVPAGGIWAALRHIGAAHPVAAAAAGVSAVTLAATVTAVPSHPARPAAASPARVGAPAAGIDESAVPAPPSSLPHPAAVPQPDTRSVRKAPPAARVPQAAPPPALPSPPPPAPSAASPASPPPSPPPPSASPAAGALSAVPAELGLGAAGTGQVTLSATGGPVDWHAVCADPGVTLAGPDGAAEGTVTPGQDTALTATVSARAQAAAGAAACSVWPGGLRVTITWDAAPVPQTAASPSPSPS